MVRKSWQRESGGKEADSRTFRCFKPIVPSDRTQFPNWTVTLDLPFRGRFPRPATSAEIPDAVEPAVDPAADPAASATTLLSNLIDEDLFLQSDEEDLEKQRKRPWRV